MYHIDFLAHNMVPVCPHSLRFLLVKRFFVTCPESWGFFATALALEQAYVLFDKLLTNKNHGSFYIVWFLINLLVLNVIYFGGCSFMLLFVFLSCNVWCRASDFPREYDGACLQMRMSYSPAAHLFLFLVQWTDCHLAGALGLLRILIYKVKFLLTSMYFTPTLLISSSIKNVADLGDSLWYRFMWMARRPCPLMKEKQVLESFMVISYFFELEPTIMVILLGSSICLLMIQFILCPAVIYPSLLQLERGLTDTEDKKQKAVCMERYRRRDDEEHKQYSDVDIEREEECGICMEMNSKIVLPNCNHAMCLKCYREWYAYSSLSLSPSLSLMHAHTSTTLPLFLFPG